jgi:hypothetical protein
MAAVTNHRFVCIFYLDTQQDLQWSGQLLAAAFDGSEIFVVETMLLFALDLQTIARAF